MAELSKGVEIRAQMDIEFCKALVLINGAGIIALLTFLSSIFEVPRYASLARPAIGGVLLLVAGLLAALYYIRFSRECSLVYEQHGMRPPTRYLVRHSTHTTEILHNQRFHGTCFVLGLLCSRPSDSI